VDINAESSSGTGEGPGGEGGGGLGELGEEGRSEHVENERDGRLKAARESAALLLAAEITFFQDNRVV
jgi:hypothetical protein